MSERALIFSIDGFGKDSCGWTCHADESLSLAAGYSSMYHYQGEEIRMNERVVWGSTFNEPYKKMFRKYAKEGVNTVVFYDANILVVHNDLIRELFPNIFIVEPASGEDWHDPTVCVFENRSAKRIVPAPPIGTDMQKWYKEWYNKN